jgi:hypothetical protein
VVRSLERLWEEQLAAQQQVAEAYHRFAASQPRLLSAAERAAIRALAADMPALWQTPAVTATERKEILRQVIEQVTVAVQGQSERVQVRITWVGGLQTEGWVIRPVARSSQLSYYGPLRAAIEAGVAAGLPLATLADQLNAAGYRPPKRCEQFTAHILQEFIRRLRRHPRSPVVAHGERLGPDEWWLTDLAQCLDLPPVTLYHWLRRGWLTARREDQSPRRWIIWADAAEVARLRAFHQRPVGEAAHRRWTEAPAAGTPTAQSTKTAHDGHHPHEC